MNALTLTGEMPATPLILLPAKVLSEVERLAEVGKTFKITDAAQANVAAQYLREATGLSKDIEKAREEVKRPFLEFGRRIDAATKGEIAKLDASIKTLKATMTAWQAEQDRLARIEAERLRKEQERLAREAAEAEKARLAAEAAQRAAAAAQADDEDDLSGLAADMEAEQAAQKAKQAAAQAVEAARQLAKPAAPAAPAGVHYRTTLKHTVVDVSKLPAALTIVTANETEIRRLYCQGWKEGDAIPTVAGVSFTIDKQPIINSHR